jgi:chromosome segregation ATPase
MSTNVADKAESLDADAAAAKIDAKRVRRELETARAEAAETLEQLRATEEELGGATQKGFTLQHELAEAREEIADLAAAKTKLSQSVTNAKTLFKSLQSRNGQLQHEIDTLRSMNLDYE